MSLPTSSKPAQRSIRSFFQSRQPQYVPPPSQSKSQGAPPPPPPPPPPAAFSSSDPEPEPPADIPPPPSDLPREASIRSVTAADINALRRINALLLPVSYQDDFYRRAADPEAQARTSRVITWAHEGEEAKVVGGVVCRVEPVHAGSRDQTLYIQSLCILAPYRSLGLVNAAVDNIVAAAVADPAHGVSTVSAHVWTESEDALKWYEGRGFKRDTHPITGYYRKLRPDTAWLVQRDATTSVLSSVPSKDTPPSTARPVEAGPTAAVVNLPPMNGPPKSNGRPPPTRTGSGQSYQNQRAETEWNDLPADMAPGISGPPKKGASEPASNTSSRSSSAATRKRRDRSYPAAAFGAS